ncbi:hypothetical protein BGX31_006752, partial [Mortierella sp. GBA43]
VYNRGHRYTKGFSDYTAADVNNLYGHSLSSSTHLVNIPSLPTLHYDELHDIPQTAVLDRLYDELDSRKKSSYDKMDSAIDTLTKKLENGGYFRQVSPKDFDVEVFFARFDDKRQAIWTTTVIPRLISSKHSTLQRAGVALQRKWNSRPYRITACTYTLLEDFDPKV